MTDGSIVQFGGPGEDYVGLDLVGTLVGSEGTLAVVTKIWTRLTPDPQGVRTLLAIFDSVDDATDAISEIIGAGIIPAALEMMDQGILVAIEAASHFGFPLDAAAILLIEVDGLEAGLDRQRDRITQICTRNRCPRGAARPRRQRAAEICGSAARRPLPRSAGSAPAIARRMASCRERKLPHIQRRITEIGTKYACQIVNVFHAGDGNIHPVLLFDERNPEEIERVLAAGGEILEECIAIGGSVTGEHGIGVEKISFMHKLFSPTDLDAMRRLRARLQSRRPAQPGQNAPHRRCAAAWNKRILAAGAAL